MEDQFPISPRLARDFGLVPYRTRYYAPKVAQDPVRWGLPIPSHSHRDPLSLEVSGRPPHRVTSKALLNLSPRYPRDEFLSRSTELVGPKRPGGAGGKRQGRGVVRTRVLLGADVLGEAVEQGRGFVGGLLEGSHSYPRHMQGDNKSGLLAQLSPLSATSHALFPASHREVKLRPIRLGSTPEVEAEQMLWQDLPWRNAPTEKPQILPCQEKRSFQLFRLHRDPPDQYLRKAHINTPTTPKSTPQADSSELPVPGPVQSLLQPEAAVEDGFVSLWKVAEVLKWESSSSAKLAPVQIPRDDPIVLIRLSPVGSSGDSSALYEPILPPKVSATPASPLEQCKAPSPVLTPDSSPAPLRSQAPVQDVFPEPDAYAPEPPQIQQFLQSPEPLSIQPDLSPISAAEPILSFAPPTLLPHLTETHPANSQLEPMCHSPEIPFAFPPTNLETSADSSEFTAFQPTAVNSEAEVTRQTVDAEPQDRETEAAVAREYAKLMAVSVGYEEGEAQVQVRKGRRGRKNRKHRRKAIEATEISAEMAIPETAEELAPSRGLDPGLYLEDPMEEEVWPIVPDTQIPAISVELTWDLAGTGPDDLVLGNSVVENAAGYIAPEEIKADSEEIPEITLQGEFTLLPEEKTSILSIEDPFEAFLLGFARSLLAVIEDVFEEKEVVEENLVSAEVALAIPLIPDIPYASFLPKIEEFYPEIDSPSPKIAPNFPKIDPTSPEIAQVSPEIVHFSPETTLLLPESPKPQSPLTPLQAQVFVRSTSARPKKKPEIAPIRTTSRRELRRPKAKAKAAPPPRTKILKRIALLRQQTELPASSSEDEEEREELSGLRQRQMAVFELKHLTMLREMAKDMLGSTKAFEEKLEQHEAEKMNKEPSVPLTGPFAYMQSPEESADIETLPVSLTLNSLFAGYRSYALPIFTSPITFNRRKQPVLDDYSLAAVTEKVEADSDNFQSAVRKRRFLNSMELQPDYEIYFALMASGLTQTEVGRADPKELVGLWRKTVLRRKQRQQLEVARVARPNVCLRARKAPTFSNLRVPVAHIKRELQKTDSSFRIESLSRNLLPSERIYLRIKKTANAVFPTNWRTQPGASGLTSNLDYLTSL